ncbi:MAG: FtsW/RodA/SpoVE family cell cycle protein [Crocinitomicaceae bacterium]|tara:strand:- start:820 stop:1995 length:1176 start_codon:yes stop_codon:yes gene_type:complete
MRYYLKYLKGDPVIWMIVILLMAFSLVTVYSFVPVLVKIEGGTPFYYLFKHFLYVFIGFISMYVIHRIDSKYIYQISKFAYYLAIGLLLFTMFFGINVNGADRWIRVPFIGLTFQSSDFAKLALMMYLSKLLVKKEKQLNDWKEGVLPVLIPIIVICGIILVDNLSTGLMLFFIAMILLFIGRFPWKKWLSIIGAGLLLLTAAITVHEAFPSLDLLPRYETWKSRVSRQFSGETSGIENAQANNAELAIYNGSITGQGVGDGRLKGYIPEAYADFYFASFIEEFGFISGLLLIFLYLILLLRIIKIAIKSDVLFESYLCLAIGIHLLLQASINMLVCTGLLPVTGQNMPFLAMGGSALIMACISIGIVQSVANKNNKKTATATSFDINGEK